MRYLLHKIAATVTQHPREVITPIWSTSVVVNVFRIYEYFFGRREGIRFEGMQLLDGSVVHGTWEHFLAHQEGRLRALKNPFAFKFVPLPVFVTSDGQMLSKNSIFNFAIAYDNSFVSAQTGPFSQQSTSYTVTGSNPIVFGWSGGAVGGGASTITSMTYNSVGMTFANNVLVPSDRWWDLYFLPACATGSNTLAANSSAANLFWIAAVSYSGVAQSGQLDATNNATQSGGSAISGSVTVVAANCWIMYISSTRGSIPSAYSPGVSRQNVSNSQIADSNGTVATGSNTCTITVNLTGSSAGMVMVSIKPVVAATVVLPFKTLLGVGI